MAFDQKTFSSVGAHSSNTPNLYAYSTDDSSIDVLAENYFLDKQFQLEAGDIISAFCSDGIINLEVNADLKSVSVAQNIIVDSSSVAGVGSLKNIEYNTLKGHIKISSLGSDLSDTPFEAGDDTEYKITIKSESGNNVVHQAMSVRSNDWSGIRLFIRMGFDAETVINEPWTEFIGGVSSESILTKTNNAFETIATVNTTPDTGISVDIFTTGKRTDGVGYFSCHQYFLGSNISNTSELIQGLETLYKKGSEGSLNVIVTPSGSSLLIQIKGKNSQVWDFKTKVVINGEL